MLATCEGDSKLLAGHDELPNVGGYPLPDATGRTRLGAREYFRQLISLEVWSAAAFQHIDNAAADRLVGWTAARLAG